MRMKDKWQCRAKYERKFHGVKWLLGLWLVPSSPIAFRYWFLMEMDGKSRYDYPGQYAYPERLPKTVKRWVARRVAITDVWH